MAKKRKPDPDSDEFDLDDDPQPPAEVASGAKADPVELGKAYLSALGVEVEASQIVPSLTAHLKTLRQIEKELSDVAPFLPAAACPYAAQVSVQKAVQGLRGVVDDLSEAVGTAIREDLSRMTRQQ